MKNKLKSDFIDACPVCSVKNPMPLIRDIALTCDPEHPEKGVFCENCGWTMPLSSSNAELSEGVAGSSCKLEVRDDFSSSGFVRVCESAHIRINQR